MRYLVALAVVLASLSTVFARPAPNCRHDSARPAPHCRHTVYDHAGQESHVSTYALHMRMFISHVT